LKDEISIVMVSYRNLNWIKYNLKLTNSLNRSQLITYIIIDNDILVKHFFNILVITFFRINLGSKNRYRLIRNDRKILKTKGAKQHALSIDFAKKYIATEITIIIDPDCVLLSKSWISYFISLLNDNSLDLFGFPQAKNRINRQIQKSEMAYKFNSPLAIFMIGYTNIIFKNTFAIDNFDKPNLDVGWRLAKLCQENIYRFRVAEAYSTREHKCKINWVNKLNCTYYEFESLENNPIGIHFGRGSNITTKIDRNLFFSKATFMVLISPTYFRYKLSKYLHF